MDIIYIDQLIITNFGINFLLLWATGKFFGICTPIRRLCLGAGTGALYSLVVYLPSVTFFLNTFIIKVLVSVLMVILTFWPLGKQLFFKYMLIFYLMAFSLGGAALGIIYLTHREVLFQQGIVFYSGSNVFLGLIFGMIMLILVGRFGLSVLTKRDWKRQLQVPMKIHLGEQSIEINGLIDTGNQLKCPITKKPVVVADYAAISSLLPEKMQSIFKQGEEIYDWEQLVLVLEHEEWAGRFSIIPFTALGKSNGMLLAFRPDKIEISDGNLLYCIKDVMVGIYQKPLSRDRTYHALLHPEVFHSGTLVKD